MKTKLTAHSHYDGEEANSNQISIRVENYNMNIDPVSETKHDDRYTDELMFVWYDLGQN